jgi:hypothetical protein
MTRITVLIVLLASACGCASRAGPQKGAVGPSDVHVGMTPSEADAPLDVPAKEPKFRAFEVSLHDAPDVRFSFSAADASSTSPVIISVPGRTLKREDRTHRVSLQKHWLSLNIPKDLSFRTRTLVPCRYRRDGEFSAADRYVFEDAAGQQFEYFFYVGNWP